MDSRYFVEWYRPPLGEGAFGVVYSAKDRDTGERVALKKIPKRFTDNVSFQREMHALLHLRDNGGHPNIVRLRENFDEGDYYYLVFDIITGGEMFDHLVKKGPYSEADAARLVREVASALAFLHGIGCVHGDLKPENLMLSTEKATDAVVQVVDFGCAEVSTDKTLLTAKKEIGGNTPAYCPPESFHRDFPDKPMDASLDMWSLGVIVYIMLTGLHPFDLNGNSTDEQIAKRIQHMEAPPLDNSPITAHLSESSIDLIKKLMAWNPNERISALSMLDHPWVQGKTALQHKMADSDKKLSMFRVFKSRLEAKVFENLVSWSDDDHDSQEDISKRTSLIERSFRLLDSQQKGFITTRDIKKLTGSKEAHDPSEKMSLSGFSDLLSENMKNRYFPKDHVIYREGDVGNHMYFINSGTIEVSTESGSVVKRGQGDFFGEGALLHPKKIRSATIRCTTPVHALEISREYFEKYLATSDSGLGLDMTEKSKIRKRNRAKTILRLQNNLHSFNAAKGDYLFKVGEEGKFLYILTEGTCDIKVNNNTVFTIKPGDICGEHSLLMGRPRNTSAVCTSDHCSGQVMDSRDFYYLLDSSQEVKESIREICLRREFQKALVVKTKRSFPSVADLRQAFDAADEEGKGKISVKEIRSILMLLDKSLSEQEVKEITQSLALGSQNVEDLVVTFDEFKRIFGMEEAKKSAMKV